MHNLNAKQLLFSCTDIPTNWKSICAEMNLPENFSVWHYYFQKRVTCRAENLISHKIAANIEQLQKDIVHNLKDSSVLEKYAKFSLWNEAISDTHRKNGYTGNRFHDVIACFCCFKINLQICR